MKLEYIGDGEIRHGTRSVTKGGQIEVDEDTGADLLKRGDFEQSGDSSPPALADVVEDEGEE